MAHYVCTGGCGGVAEDAGVCQAGGCAKQNQPLTECNCEDEKHEAVLSQAASEAPAMPATEATAMPEASSEEVPATEAPAQEGPKDTPPAF